MDKGRTTVILWTESGIVALDSPVKLKILQFLEKNSASFEELVEQSTKAKSTISVHLHDLKNLNLIKEKTYPKDKRKKYYAMNAIYLAYSQAPLCKQYNTEMDNITSSLFEGDSFKEQLFCTFRYGMEAYGIEPKPILRKLGFDMGLRIGKEFKSQDCEEILEELSMFWSRHRLGDMTVENGSNTEIFINNCYHCGKMPNVGKTLCSMDEGLIEGIFLSKLKYKCSVNEVECHGNGFDHCKFVIEKK